jgi:hypothetical protein
MTWISDSRPTWADADSDGVVEVQSPYATDVGYPVGWQMLSDLAVWRHTRMWRPPEISIRLKALQDLRLARMTCTLPDYDLLEQALLD